MKKMAIWQHWTYQTRLTKGQRRATKEAGIQGEIIPSIRVTGSSGIHFMVKLQPYPMFYMCFFLPPFYSVLFSLEKAIEGYYLKNYWIEGNFFNLIKNIYKTTTNIILNGEKLKAVSPKLGCTLLPPLCNFILESLIMQIHRRK